MGGNGIIERLVERVTDRIDQLSDRVSRIDLRPLERLQEHIATIEAYIAWGLGLGIVLPLWIIALCSVLALRRKK